MEPGDRETGADRAAAEPHRAAILAALRSRPDGLGAAELARRCRLHPNTIRWHLHHLADAGLVRSRREHTGRPGRPRLVFVASESGAVGPTGFRFLSELLADALLSAPDGPERARTTGERWGRLLVEREPAGRLPAAAAVERVVALLDDHGFEPQAMDGAVEMHRCPFAELVDAHGEVVCTVHGGLLAGALAQLGGEVGLAGLDPWARPGVCRARLAPAGVSPMRNSYAPHHGSPTMPGLSRRP